MRKLLFLLVLVAVCCLPLEAHGAEPAQAMVRIKSHGASGTIIATARGKSWILGCAHMLEDGGHQRPLKIDGPPQPQAPALKAQARLLKWDHDLDLSLIEIDNGPFHFIPVAPAGHKPNKNLLSLGYDDMKWPITVRPATLLFSQGNTTYTREKPWHGRSGGGLIDVDAHVLIGVVQGYELWPNDRGLYVSHAAILRFLAQAKLPQPAPC